MIAHILKDGEETWAFNPALREDFQKSLVKVCLFVHLFVCVLTFCAMMEPHHNHLSATNGAPNFDMICF